MLYGVDHFQHRCFGITASLMDKTLPLHPSQFTMVNSLRRVRGSSNISNTHPWHRILTFSLAVGGLCSYLSLSARYLASLAILPRPPKKPHFTNIYSLYIEYVCVFYYLAAATQRQHVSWSKVQQRCLVCQRTSSLFFFPWANNQYLLVCLPTRRSSLSLCTTRRHADKKDARISSRSRSRRSPSSEDGCMLFARESNVAVQDVRLHGRHHDRQFKGRVA